MSGDARVLVSDGVDGVARLYHHWLREEGYGVETASADESLADGRYGADVVVLDRFLSASAAPGPRLVVTGAPQRGPEVVCHAFDDYLVKPATKPDLVDAVERTLARDDYPDPLAEFAAAVSRVALARRRNTVAERADSETYRAFLGRVHELHAEAAGVVDSLDDEEVRAVFGGGERPALARRPGEVLAVTPESRDDR